MPCGLLCAAHFALHASAVDTGFRTAALYIVASLSLQLFLGYLGYIWAIPAILAISDCMILLHVRVSDSVEASFGTVQDLGTTNRAANWRVCVNACKVSGVTRPARGSVRSLYFVV